MIPVDQFETPGSMLVVFAKDQPEYIPIPALTFPDGRVLTEWSFSEEERAAIVRGENLRLWIWLYPPCCAVCGTIGSPRLQPVALEITDERKG
jgi:hypothetical protein